MGMMAVRSIEPHEGTCRLQIFRGVLPELEKQIKSAFYIKPDKRAKLPEDLLVCLEYVAAFDPKYAKPEVITSSQEDRFAAALKKKRDKLRSKRGRGVRFA